MVKAATTNRYTINSADLCRSKGWQKGDILECADKTGHCRIQITAIGEMVVLAKCLQHENYERAWILSARDWRKTGSGRGRETTGTGGLDRSNNRI